MRQLSAAHITELNTKLVDKAARLIEKKCPQASPAVKDALLQYSINYANAYEASEGQLPDANTLEQLSQLSLDEIQEYQGILPDNIQTGFMQQQAERPAPDHPHLRPVFGDRERLYFTLPEEDSPEQDRLFALIEAALPDYEIDFENGTASNDGGKNNMRLGRLLNKSGDEGLFQKWDQHCGHKTEKLMMVISRRPEDIARASTGRHWTSCMNEYGDFPERIEDDISQGSIVAYLVSESDPEIMRPLSRRLIKPYHGEVDGKKQTAMYPDNGYGLEHEGFKKAAHLLCANSFNNGLRGAFQLDEHLYQDGITGFTLDENGEVRLPKAQKRKAEVRHLPDHLRDGQCSAEDLLNHLGYKYKNQKGKLILERGQLNLSGMGIRQLPDLSNIECGHLNCSNNELSELPPLPPKLTSLTARQNKLETLPENLPSQLTSLNVSQNQLMWLPSELPEKLTELNCGENQLLELPEKLPQDLRILSCSSNQLASLPQVLPQNLDNLSCALNNLSTLPGELPPNLRHLNCSHNRLIVMPMRLPETLQDLNCAHNQLGDLPRVLPPKLRGLDCTHNRLSTLPRLPETLEKLACDENDLSELQPDMPQGLHTLTCKKNPRLETLPDSVPSTCTLKWEGRRPAYDPPKATLEMA